MRRRKAMRIRKGGISREIDDNRLAEYLEKGYSAEQKHPEEPAKEISQGRPRKTQK